VQRLVDRAQSEGLHVFARVDHAAAAHDVGLELRPTVLVLVGHPRGGTALMQDQQTAGIDLPAKALVWEDDEGRVWLGYNDPGWISRRHGLSAATAPRVVGISNGLADLAAAATSSLPASPG
jgi:uncharacterized protein (DUF302 family)